MTCEHMRANPDLTYDSRYVCQCGACHDDVIARIVHRPRYSTVENECSKCGAKWTAQVVFG